MCHLWEKDEEREIGHLLSNEVVMDPGFRDKVLLAKGFCSYHSHKLFKAIYTDFREDSLGLALYFQGIADAVLDELVTISSYTRETPKRGGTTSRIRKRRLDFSNLSSGVSKAIQGKQACPACQSLEASDRAHLNTLLRMLDDEDFRGDFRSSLGLCLPHFASAFSLLSQTSLANSGEVALALMGTEISHLQSVGQLLSEFIKKQSYEFLNEPRGEEVKANSIALNTLTGVEGRYSGS